MRCDGVESCGGACGGREGPGRSQYLYQAGEQIVVVVADEPDGVVTNVVSVDDGGAFQHGDDGSCEFGERLAASARWLEATALDDRFVEPCPRVAHEQLCGRRAGGAAGTHGFAEPGERRDPFRAILAS